jgi:hypothetical protein
MNSLLQSALILINLVEFTSSTIWLVSSVINPLYLFDERVVGQICKSYDFLRLVDAIFGFYLMTIILSTVTMASLYLQKSDLNLYLGVSQVGYHLIFSLMAVNLYFNSPVFPEYLELDLGYHLLIILLWSYQILTSPSNDHRQPRFNFISKSPRDKV